MTETTKSKTTNIRLSLQAGKFEITGIPEEKLRLNPYWKKTRANTFETLNLGAAVKFRKRADERTEKTFKRLFQTHYPIPEEIPPLLRELPIDPHQYDGILWVLSRKRSYLAHAPGAGKTAQAILAACLVYRRVEAGQFLFIVPPGLAENWKREFQKFIPWILPHANLGEVIPRSAEREQCNWDADFLIVPDSMLSKDWVQAELVARRKRFLFIAVDEASRFKESTSIRSLAFYGGVLEKLRYPGLFQFARHVVFLDGSPMPTRAMDIWAPTFALCPEAIDYKNYDEFGYRYCGAKPNQFGQWEYLYSSNELELRDKLRKDFMHVVTEDMLSHPERRRSMLFMDQDVRSPESREWERRNITRHTVLTENDSQGDLARYRRELGLRKVKWVSSYVSRKLEDTNESLLLFAWHREVCVGLSKALTKWNPGLIMGGVSTGEREHFYDLFQRGIIRVLILNIQAAGRGLNLQRAGRVVFAEFSWSDETNRQAEKRASRKGSEKEFVRCEYIVNPGSIDETVLNSVFRKARMVKKVIG